MLADQAADLDDDEAPSNCRRLDFDDCLDDEDEPDADSDDDLTVEELNLASGLLLGLVAAIRLRQASQLSPWRSDWRNRFALGDRWASRWQ